MADDDFCRGSFCHLHASPGALLHPQFFAEDGWVWYEQAYNLHWLRSLFIPQAGCLYIFPRLVAGVSLLFPMQWAPLIMNFAGAMIQALPVSALLSRRCSPWGPLPVRMLMAALYIAIPDAPEIHVVLTNAVWHLALLQALLAFSLPPLSWRGRVSDIILFGIAGITGPFSILLLPAVVAYWWFRRQRWTLVVLALMFAGAVIQGMSILHTVRTRAPLGCDPTPSFADHRRQHLYRQYGRHRRPKPAHSTPRRRRHRRIVNPGLGMAQRTPRGTPLYRLRDHRSYGGPERSSPAAEQHSSLGDARECYGNPLLVLAVVDVSLVRRMVRIGRKKQARALCRTRRSVAHDGWRCSKMDLPAVAQ